MFDNVNTFCKKKIVQWMYVYMYFKNVDYILLKRKTI